MRLSRARSTLAAAGLLTLIPGHAVGQIPVLIHGRVEDAVSGEPVTGVRLVPVDSSSAVFTDSVGAFTLPMERDSIYAVDVERFGYQPRHFALPEDAPSHISVFQLEPEVIALDGIDVVAEAAITRVLGGLEARRREYPGAVRSYDRAELDRLAAAQSVLDFVRRRHRVRECESDRIALCTSRRVRTPSSASQLARVLVCIDGSPSSAPVLDLASLETEAVAVLETYGGVRPEQIRVYTPGYLTWKARVGRLQTRPLQLGC